MKPRVRRWLRLAPVALVASSAVLAWVMPATRAQNWGGPWTILTAGGILPLPPPPPQGAFGEVIFANAKWIVVQNQSGHQYPIAADAIGQFLIRWPAATGDLTPAVLVEAIGLDLGSMTIQTDHIDIFKGSDQSLVQPNYASVLPTVGRAVTAIDPTFQRTIIGFDIAPQNTLYSWVYPTVPGENNIPGKMHAVGNAVALGPLRLSVPGNNIVNVLPQDPGVMTITQVTQGSSSFAQKGDQVFLTPLQSNAVGEKTLRLSQLVLYKKVRRDQFAP